jgi:crotonobetainyl-CoA:carnitine CoA-transferase CaiB-like acyl-CoA transferase
VVDVAILDCMAVSMITFPSVFASFLDWPPLEGTGRSIQIPSIEPSSDGHVVFTTNSAQQFQDFLVLIERPDLLEDPDLAQAGKRFIHREPFLKAVRSYTQGRSTSELLEAAAAFRIPAAPVLDARSVLDFEHFTERAVFVPSASGRFAQPRVPYRIAGFPPCPFRTPSAEGVDTVAISWAEPQRRTPAETAWHLPLTGVRVVDLTAWWAGPSGTHLLAALGADVVKVESIARPDQMRFSSTRRPPADDWWEWGPIFHGANLSKCDVTLDLGTAEGLRLVRRLIATADLLIENFTPRVIDQFGLDFETLRTENPGLIMVRMPAFGLDGPWRDRTGFAQTMEAVSGLAWRTGFEDDLPTLVLGACDPLAGAHGAFAVILALRARGMAGGGTLVESVMVESALNIAAEAIVEYGAGGPILGRLGNRGPDAAPQGVYPGLERDTWVAIAVESDAQWDALVDLLGSSPCTAPADLGTAEGRVKHHDEIDTYLEAWTSSRTAESSAAMLAGVGVPAEVVIAARDVVRNPQLQYRRLFEIEHHPVTGSHPVPTLPFRYTHVSGWLRNASPTLGQHNDEILDAIGVDADERDALRARSVIGESLAGS